MLFDLFYFFEHHPDIYASWMGVPTLPKLDHCADQLRDRLLRGPGSVTARWLRPPVSADGWRIDVANMTGRRGAVDLAHRVAADMRATMRDVEAETEAHSCFTNKVYPNQYLCQMILNHLLIFLILFLLCLTFHNMPSFFTTIRSNITF